MGSGRRDLVALALFAVLTGGRTADAQTPSAARASAGSRVAWTLIGSGIGFGAGLLFGLAQFDDAVYAERKIWATAVVGAVGGGVAGNLLSRPGTAGTRPRAQRDPLWNGMAIGAASGAAVGLWYVPATNCKTDINPECPRALRLAVGIPAIAGGAALGALLDRAVEKSRSAPAVNPSPSTGIAPVVARRAVGVVVYRSF